MKKSELLIMYVNFRNDYCFFIDVKQVLPPNWITETFVRACYSTRVKQPYFSRVHC